MANIIKPKRSNTAGLVPTTGNLTSGELGVNMADKKIYINNGSSVVQVGGGNLSALGDTNISAPSNGQSLAYDSASGKWINSNAGAGDVTGAASSTDNAVVRFDGTTGKVIQNSTVTLDDNGNFANVNALGFDTTPGTLPTATGSMFWDTGNGSPSIILDADVSLQVGQEMLALVYNGTGSTITNGSVVAVSGAQGQRPSVVLADADSEALSAPTLGIATEDIANGAEGFVTTFGFVRGLNTSAFTAGAPIYLSQTAGQFTATRPSAPAHTVALGWVIKSNASSGEVFVNINNGWELDELHNVLISSPVSGNTLIYDASVGVWKNANLTDGTGITITEGAGSITITNSGVTSAVAGTGISVSGATGAVTITNTGVTSAVAGTGITVSGATGAVTVTNNDRGSSQNIFKNIAVSGQSTIVAANNNDTLNFAGGTGITITTNATTDTVTITGTGGTVTSVGMTVPTGLSVAGSPITSSGTLAITYAAGYSIPTTASQTNWDSAYTQRLQWDGGSTNLVAATGRTSLGATTLGGNLFTITNPSAVTFPRFNADNTVSALDAATFRSAIGAGTSSTTGTVTSITAGTGLSGGTITTSGTISLANTAVTAGSYTNANITVDAQGRITAASSGSGGGVTSISAGTGISVNASTGAVTVTNTGVTSVNGSTGAVTISTLPSGFYQVEYLVVGGGGGGGRQAGGGGGGGGFVAGSMLVSGSTAYTVTVGAGGSGQTSATLPNQCNGSNSQFHNVVAYGGGGGAGYRGNSNYYKGNSGGSGGGGWSYSANTNSQPPGQSIAGQGTPGSPGAPGGSYQESGGGGGGAGGAPAYYNNNTTAGNGGDGRTWLNGSTYGGGGGAGASNYGAAQKGTGGSGGGGAGGDGAYTTITAGTAGTANTGGGGGGGGGSTDARDGGNGGSGIVIVRYPGSQKGSGGTVSSSGGYTYHTFTSSGTYTA